MSDDRVFTHLDAVQTDGMACVMCGTRFGDSDTPANEPVGRSESGTLVYACSASCAELAILDDDRRK